MVLYMLYSLEIGLKIPMFSDQRFHLGGQAKISSLFTVSHNAVTFPYRSRYNSSYRCPRQASKPQQQQKQKQLHLLGSLFYS